MSTMLKQSTAVDIAVGPFLDSTDGNTAETALTITQPDIRLKKNGGAWAQKSAAQTLTHEEAGWYECSLSATDTDTLGELVVAIHETGALPVWRTFQIVPAATYDTLVTNGLPTNATIADAVWDEAASGHVANGSFGALNQLGHSGTCQTHASPATEVKLAATASAVDDAYNGMVIVIIGGDGRNQVRVITDYVGSTKIATVAAWAIQPLNTSRYVVVAA